VKISHLLTGILMIAATPALAQEDPYLWLEDVLGDKPLAWVKEQNAKTQKLLEASPQFAEIRDKAAEILNSRERIPAVSKRGKWFYNFWQDEKNVRGVWRRTSLEEFKKSQPKWETVLDLDQLAKDEKENWVWKGSTCLYPDYTRCLLTLSRGGADAAVVREFDVVEKAFVKGGFELKESKGGAAWIDRDTLFVQTDFGPGSMTQSGYARIVKEWKRGTPLESARVVFEGKDSDISVQAFQIERKGYPTRQWVRRGVTFFTAEHYLRDPITGKLEKLAIPDDANPSFVRELMFVTLRSAWTVGGKTWPQGALISIQTDAFLKGSRAFSVVFEPSERKSLAGFTSTKNFYILNELDNVKNVLYELTLQDGKWKRRKIDLPGLGTIGANGIDDEEMDEYFLTVTDYLTPSTLFLAKAGTDLREKIKALPAFFDASPYIVEQFEATSKDGEKIPYFVVRNRNLKKDGRNPTYLYAYGGFQISQLPAYSATVGNAWLANGGVYVVANIRGGGEFGPRWHQAGLKANRQKVFDDFIAVAEDLVANKITSPAHLAIGGGSNGGLLVGAVMVQRPDLFKAVVCSVPLLDMKRYNKLLAGASWVAEYGNPDNPDEWAYISKYSPYQNVKAGVKMPKVLFVTSTRDDRVHPGHARKMMARMLEQGHDVLYYENTEGGHAGAANNAQIAYRTALQYAFLLNELK
jgi:prolyl oligopeptidase